MPSSRSCDTSRHPSAGANGDQIPRAPARDQRWRQEQGVDGAAAAAPGGAWVRERCHVHRQRQRDPGSDRSPGAIKRQIEAALPRAFRLDSELIAALVLSRAQLRAVVNRKPKGFGDHPETYHSDAIFLIGIDAATAMQVFDPHPEVDRVWPGDNVIYSQRLSAKRTKSRLNEATTTPLYKSMTIRSWATTMALHDLLEESTRQER
jgi:uncharacterized protein (DUF1697 family)